MVITLLRDGIGNQLFQYAVGRSLADKLKTDFKLDAISEANSDKTTFYLQNFNIQADFATPEEVEKIKNNSYYEEKFDDKVNRSHDWNWRLFFQSEIFNLPKDSYISGVWLTEKYFKNIESIIRKEFTLKNPLGKNSSKWKEKILSSACSVSLHFRIVNNAYSVEKWGIVSNEYYKACVSELKKFYSDIDVFVFSNNLNLAKKNLNLDVNLEFVEGCELDSEEIYLMSLCKHNIIGQSSFSWWGAWLNQNPDKKVFGPYPFYRKISVPDIYVDDWIKMPAKFAPSPYPPSLSVIVYVENNFSEFKRCLESIENQAFQDYEVIFVCDDQTDERSLKICEDFIKNRDNVVYLKQSRKLNKYVAWNRGIDISSGEHLIFITSKNTIRPKTVRSLSSVCLRCSAYDGVTEHNEYVFNADTVTDVISSVDDSKLNSEKILLESVNVMYKDFYSKGKFMCIPVDERLKFLASGGVNSSVQTKFFKRKFLQKNNIHFDETAGENVEMLFLTECFFKTDDLVFISHVFVE